MLEQRGYVTAGPYTPEVVLEYPTAVREIHREFALCGADILEAFSFNGTDDNLNKARTANNRLCAKEVCEAGCKIVQEVAKEQGCLAAGPVSSTDSYRKYVGKKKVQEEFLKQVAVYQSFQMDLLIAEFFMNVEEAEWAVEVMQETGFPVAISMCMGPLGDYNNISVEECGIRLAKSGADIIGLNC